MAVFYFNLSKYYVDYRKENAKKEKHMATEIYLGTPPQYVIDWIKAHSKPAANPKTKIMFIDGSVEEYDWSGEIT